MDKLLLKKFISRENCSNDRRVVFVEITPIGLDVLAKIDVKFANSKITPKGLTDEEAETLSNLLDKIRLEYY